MDIPGVVIDGTPEHESSPVLHRTVDAHIAMDGPGSRLGTESLWRTKITYANEGWLSSKSSVS